MRAQRREDSVGGFWKHQLLALVSSALPKELRLLRSASRLRARNRSNGIAELYARQVGRVDGKGVSDIRLRDLGRKAQNRARAAYPAGFII